MSSVEFFEEQTKRMRKHADAAKKMLVAQQELENLDSDDEASQKRR